LRNVRWAKRFLTFAELPEEEAFRRSYSLFDPEELVDLLSPDLAGCVEEIVDEHRAVYEDTTLTDHVNRMCLADARLFLPGLNLTYTDRASMAASTEVRVPFVDTEVVRAAFSHSGSEKIRHGRGKMVLKEAAERSLPKEIVYRPKASFSAPLRAWVNHELRPLVDDVLLSGELVQTGFLRQAAVERLVEEERTGRHDRSKQIWQMLTLELWLRHARAQGVAG
jgi:asparagine synthase (glutamine-hydrolysing)